MADESGHVPDRLDSRKERSTAALVEEALGFLAAGEPNVPILELSEVADVGMGSFCNQFRSEDELFHAAMIDAIDRFGTLLDALTADLEDPAHIFAQSFRLTGRMHRSVPKLSKVLLNSGLALTSSDQGIARRAQRDIEAGIAVGRFSVRDAEVAVIITAGATMSLGQFLQHHPERDDAEATDCVAEDLLRMLGLPADEAHEMSRRPLPDADPDGVLHAAE